MAFQKAMMSEESMRNFKEFLQMYNQTTERCFKHCIYDLHHRDVTSDEDKCLNDCTTKTAKLSHRVLGAFMVEQPRITQQKLETAQKEAELLKEKLEAQGIQTENLTPDEMAQKMFESMQKK